MCGWNINGVIQLLPRKHDFLPMYESETKFGNTRKLLIIRLFVHIINRENNKENIKDVSGRFPSQRTNNIESFVPYHMMSSWTSWKNNTDQVLTSKLYRQ